jgi:hypothetical protein
MKNWLSYGLFLSLVSVTTIGWANDDEKALIERATSFWNARAAGDWAAEYRFLQPEDTHGGTEKEFIEFRKGPGGAFKFSAVKLGEAAVAGGLGWVKVSYDLQSLAFTEYDTDHHEIWDIWLVKDGQWYPMAKDERKQVPQFPPALRPAAEEALLTQRAEDYWKAKKARDRGLLYEFLAPDVRKVLAREQFLKRKAEHAYASYRVEWTEIIDNRGRVKVAYTQEPGSTTGAKPEAKTTIDTWYKIDGQWYLGSPATKGD